MSKSLIISPFENPNWFTEKGVALKIKEIRGKGIPDLRNARFVTLTIDQKQHSSPVSAYLRGKRQMRQFIYELRLKVGVKFGYAWKLEFHENGYPHWHCLLLYKKKMPYSYVDDCWRLGRTNTQRVKSEEFEYLFKYVSKTVENIPDWVQDAQFPISFWQTSGFHDIQKTSPRPDSSEKGIRPFRTIRQKIHKWKRMVLVTKTAFSEPRKRYRILELNTSFSEFYEYFRELTTRDFKKCYLYARHRVQINNPKHLIQWIPQQKNLVSL